MIKTLRDNIINIKRITNDFFIYLYLNIKNIFSK